MSRGETKERSGKCVATYKIGFSNMSNVEGGFGRRWLLLKVEFSVFCHEVVAGQAYSNRRWRCVGSDGEGARRRGCRYHKGQSAGCSEERGNERLEAKHC